MAVTNYTTKEGDRWDTVAYAAYGDVTKIPLIADANPDVPLDDIIPAGTNLYIPILEQATIVQDKQLPPWK